MLHIEAGENSEIRVLDINGHEVIPPFTYSESNNLLNTEGFSEGIYFIKISNNGYTTIRRIFIN